MYKVKASIFGRFYTVLRGPDLHRWLEVMSLARYFFSTPQLRLIQHTLQKACEANYTLFYSKRQRDIFATLQNKTLRIPAHTGSLREAPHGE